MTTTAPAPGYQSGHCGVGAHDRCRGLYAGIACDCPHHTEPPVVTVHCAQGCRSHTETGSDPHAVHDAMERHYATAHPEPVALHHCPSCTCVGVP